MPTDLEPAELVLVEDQRTDEGEADEVQPLRYAISSYGADYPVDGLVRRIREGAIYVPKFQREFVADGLIPQEFGERFQQATQLHQDADIGLQSPPDCDRLKELLASAESFLTTTRLFLAK